MNLSLARYCRNRDGWELVTLTDDEIKEAQTAVREQNNILLEVCLVDALRMLQKHRPWANNVQLATPLALQLFERQAIHISLVLDAVLKRKVHELKNGGGDE